MLDFVPFPFQEMFNQMVFIFWIHSFIKRVSHLLDSPCAGAFLEHNLQPKGQLLIIPIETQWGLEEFCCCCCWGFFWHCWKAWSLPHSSLKNKQFHGHYSHKCSPLSHRDWVGAWITFRWMRMFRAIQTKTCEWTTLSFSHLWDGFVLWGFFLGGKYLSI